MHLPPVAGVEHAVVEEVPLFGLGQQEQVGLHAAQARGGVLPELDRHEHRHIAAEAVHGVPRDPELHGRGLGLPYVAVRIVELGRIGPIPRHGGLARGVALVPRSGLPGDPPRIARSVVGHPVHEHLHAEAVRFGHEVVEIVHRAQLGIDGAVVADRIVGAERALAVLLPDRVDGHEPHGIDAQIAQEFQPRGGGAQRAFGRELAHVHFIEHGPVAPFGMLIHRHCVLGESRFGPGFRRPKIRFFPKKNPDRSAQETVRRFRAPRQEPSGAAVREVTSTDRAGNGPRRSSARWRP